MNGGPEAWAEGQVILNCCPGGRGAGRRVQRPQYPVKGNSWRAEHRGVKRSGLGWEPSLWPWGGEGLEGAGGETGRPVRRPASSAGRSRRRLGTLQPLQAGSSVRPLW